MSSLFPSLEHAVRSLFLRGSITDAAPAREVERKAEYLREVDILRDLTDEEMAWLKDLLPMVTCEPGRIIYGQEENAEVLFLLKRGRVQLYRLSSEGKKLELATIGPHTFFGEMPLLGQQMHQAFAEAVEDSLICVLSRADVEQLIAKKPQVAVRMLEVVSARLAASESQLEALAFHGVPARLAAALLRLAKDDVVQITHRELAEMIGAYRETVTKTLDDFQRDGLVELGRMRITVRDRPGLEKIAGI